MEQIAPNPHQPRREFAPGPLAELAESIRRHGIIQPLSVRRRDDGWELIAGERRLRAAKLAGLQTVPCLEMQVDEQDTAILALIENIQRRDLRALGGSRRHRRLSPSIRLHARGSRCPAGPLPLRSGQ
ncbi:MAG: ParB/RepB/Spo0J family partition protein [Dysosmobacter sp.]